MDQDVEHVLGQAAEEDVDQDREARATATTARAATTTMDHDLDPKKNLPLFIGVLIMISYIHRSLKMSMTFGV